MAVDLEKAPVVWTKRNKSGTHFATASFTGLVVAITIGMMQLSSGINIVPLSNYFHIGRGEAASYLSIMGYVLTVLYLIGGTIMNKISSRIWMTVGLACGAVAFISIYFAQTYSTFKIAAVLMAITCCFCGGVFQSSMATNWFQHKVGTALGAVVMCGVAGSVIWSSLGSWIIASYGWRYAYLVVGILLAVLVLVALVFIRFRPAEKGLLPYGAEDHGQPLTTDDGKVDFSQIPGVTPKRALRSVAFWLIVIYAALAIAVNAMANNIPGYAMANGMSLTQAGVLGSVNLLGWMLSNIILGSFVDKVGLFKGGIVVGSCGIIGLLILILHPSTTMMFVGAFIFGLTMGLPMIGHALAAQKALGMKYFSVLAAWINACIALSYYFFIAQYATIFDKTGSYLPGLYLCIGFIVICIILLKGIQIFGDKLKKDF